MREKGELDTQIYDKIKSDMAAAKVQTVIAREFPSAQSEMKYPEHGLNMGNLLYRSSNQIYGTVKPCQQDFPCNDHS
jgi:hypothetical protein